MSDSIRQSCCAITSDDSTAKQDFFSYLATASCSTRLAESSETDGHRLEGARSLPSELEENASIIWALNRFSHCRFELPVPPEEPEMELDGSSLGQYGSSSRNTVRSASPTTFESASTKCRSLIIICWSARVRGILDDLMASMASRMGLFTSSAQKSTS